MGGNFLYLQKAELNQHVFQIENLFGHKNHFNANRLGDPIELIFQKVVNSDFSLSLDFVSTKLKNIMFDKFKNYPELTKLVMSLETNDDKTHNKFWQSIQKIDSVRASGFRDICPDLASLLS